MSSQDELTKDDILLQVVLHFSLSCGVELDDAAQREARSIFQRTIGRRIDEIGTGEWEKDEQLRKHLLLQVKLIAREACRGQDKAPVSRKALAAAADLVIRKEQQECRERADYPEIMGSYCATY